MLILRHYLTIYFEGLGKTTKRPFSVSIIRAEIRTWDFHPLLSTPERVFTLEKDGGLAQHGIWEQIRDSGARELVARC